MADDAAKALKLAQKNEKQINLLWRKIARFEKSEAEWEKKQTKTMADIQTSLREYIQKVEKNLVDGVNDMHTKQGKAMAEMHKRQDKKFTDAVNNVVKWVEKTFDKKGLFN